MPKPESTETPASVLKQQRLESEPLVTPEDFSWHCIHTLTGHQGSVLSVAIGVDRQTLASGSIDNTIKLWNVKTGDLLYTLTEHLLPVSCVAMSVDGQMLASGSRDSTIKLWAKN